MRHARHPRARHPREAGAALIFALGILACLTLLATAFATLTQIELRASHNYRDGERAGYAALSGIERAKFELRRSVTTPGFPLPWLVYEPATMVKTQVPDLDVTTNPQDPSFKFGFTTVPALLQKNPPTVPYPSGFTGSTYYNDPTTPEMLGDYYALRVTDCNAQVYLNDENPHLGMMLDNLAWAAQAPGATGIGAKILSQRPVAGFRHVEDLKGILTPAQYDALRPYVTVHAFVDRKVVQAGPQPAAPALAFQPRAPIDVNLAPMPVLVAALAGIGYTKPTAVLLSQQKALLLANEIIAYRANPNINFGQPTSDLGSPGSPRYGFASWPELAAFLKRSAQVGGDPLMCSAILANANPNTDLNKFVPDSSMYHPVDKTDLAGATTELRFGSGGYFTIESLGVVLGPDGVPIAASRMRATVRVFEEYCDTTQADFEVDRLDPKGAAGYPGLRDITTGPEWRNAYNAQLTGNTPDEDGLLAARYDGHLTFNAIAAAELSPQGGYAGFIDRTVDGTGMKDVSATPVRTLATQNAGPLVPNLAAPDWQTGTDLLPLGVYTGRDGRNFEVEQDPVVATTTHDVPKDELSTSPINYIKTIYSQTVTPQFLNDPNTGAVTPISPIITQNPPQDVPEQLPAIGPEPVPAWSYESVDKLGLELWFKPAWTSAGRQDLISWTSGAPEVATKVVGQTFYWGKKATLTVWLEPDSTPPADSSFTVHARFTIEGTSYDREWIYGQVVRAGTWHHVLMSFWVPKQGQEAAPPEHTMLYVDGNNIGSTAAEPAWPTYTHPQALAMHAVADDLIGKAQAAVVANGITGSLVMANPINTSDPAYQIPVQFPRGEKVFFAGKRDQYRFTGIVDNIIVQGNWAKKMPGAYGSDQYVPRFDSYRPSAGANGNGGFITFQKRAQALEWDRPIRVIACDSTAWKSNAADDGGELLLGDVFLRFGWWQKGGAGTGTNQKGNYPSMNQSYAATDPSGWTPPLQNVPWNAVANGYLVPDRGQVSGQPAGFLTNPGTEEELYAVQIGPTNDPQPGPRMAPIVDDVRVIYMPWDVVTVLEEVELVD